MDATDTIIAWLDRTSRDGSRTLLAICGAPASGKSTLANAVTRRLCARGDRAVLVPMDGYHLDNAVLQSRGLLERKGAPETFDAAGFASAMERLRTGAEVVLPRFDRARDIAIAGAIVVDPSDEIVVVEGNYLCLDEAPWSALQTVWDMTVRLDVPHGTLRDRLMQRWLDQGLSLADAASRADGNDLRNAERVACSGLPVDLVIGET